MEKKNYKLYSINKVNKRAYKYMWFIESLQLALEVAVGGVLYLFLSQYISLAKWIFFIIIILIIDVLEMIISIVRLKHNYFTFDEQANCLIIYCKDFYDKKCFVPLMHIKCITITQNFAQKKYDLADVICSTGVSKYKIQLQSPQDAEKIKSELIELINRDEYDEK